MLVRHYEAGAVGRRTQGWNRATGDANAVLLGYLERVRNNVRDLTRNNPYAESALTTIVDHVVGWGIVAAPKKGSSPKAPSNVARALWKAWAETKACDADGRQDFYGLQAQVMRTVVEAGECLVRRRWRRPEDELPIPLQLQVLEPDFLDTQKEGAANESGNRIIQGVEFNRIGQRVAYWLFSEHPGSIVPGTRFSASHRIPASEILHVFKPGRPGQVRGPSWFAQVLLRMKDFDEYDDATLMKQKIAACLAVIMTDIDGSAPALGTKDTTATPELDSLEPGMILRGPPGQSIGVIQPPSVNEYDAYSKAQLRAIATGLGVTFEDLTGDYVGLPFSAARMSRLRHWARVHGWRWKMLIPQFCDPVWGWAMEAAAIVSPGLTERPIAEWTAPPMPMIEPDKEGLAYARNIRAGITSLSESHRELGYDPDVLLAEIASDNEKLDALGLILDSDARMTTQAGQPRDVAKQPSDAPPSTVEDDGSRTRKILDAISALGVRLSHGHGNGNGHRKEPITVNVAPSPVHVDGATITVESPPVTIADGAIRVETPVTVQPSPVTIADGAVRVSVESPDVRVENPVTISEGAVKVEVAPPNVEVITPPMSIAEGAVQVQVDPPDINVAAPNIKVEAPVVTVNMPESPPPPEPRPIVREVHRDEKNLITKIVDRPEESS
jgi:lambda family phage portal protein